MKRLTLEEIESAIKIKSALWARQCHAISLAIVRSGCVGTARVARGWCEGVYSQHSWVVAGMDCYSPFAEILDCTIWSYDLSYSRVHYDTMRSGRYHPHGMGEIDLEALPTRTGPEIHVKGMNRMARAWLNKAAPRGLDWIGWHYLMSRAGVQGWPAGAITQCVSKDDRLRALIPIDRLGMLTDANPGELYMAVKKKRRKKA